MRILNTIASLMAASLLLASCVRKQPVVAPTPDPVGGKGGKSTLNIVPQHHTKDIDSCMVYIKYDATNLPKSMIFDDSMKVVQDVGGPTATFTGLKQGNYYIYGKGWDPDIAEDVVGGQTFRIIDTLSYNLKLAVTEGD